MSLIVPAAARGAVDAACAYLARDRIERSLIERLERSRRMYRLRIVHDGNDAFEPGSDIIRWDPHSALRTTEGGRQSPALGLGHEIDHAVENRRTEQRLARRVDPVYDTAEERRVITGSERHAARTLGEAIRHDHGGTTYRVASPTAMPVA